MTGRLLALALTFTPADGAHALAPKPPAGRAAVQALTPGEKVAVRTRDGHRLKGRLDSADGDAINFTRDGRKVTLRRESVGTGAGTYLLPRSDHFANSIIPAGSVVGAAVGHDTTYEAL